MYNYLVDNVLSDDREFLCENRSIKFKMYLSIYIKNVSSNFYYKTF